MQNLQPAFSHGLLLDAIKETFNHDPPLSIYRKKIPPYLCELPVTGGVFWARESNIWVLAENHMIPQKSVPKALPT
jgi:hypothetical protein